MLLVKRVSFIELCQDAKKNVNFCLKVLSFKSFSSVDAALETKTLCCSILDDNAASFLCKQLHSQNF